MKTAEPKSLATAQHSQSRGDRSQHEPFFESLSAGEATVARSASFFSPKGGNAIQRMPFFGSGSIVQPKLRIGQSGNRYEQEADRTADQVVHRLAEGRGRSGTDSGAKTRIQRKPIFESDEDLQKMEEPGEEETLQRKPIFESDALPDEDAVQRQGASGGEGDSMSASPSLESRLQSSRGSGAALPEETRVQMEGAMGVDFSGVRVHTGSEAAGMNKELGARAFTHGSDIYFSEDNYRPGSGEGDHLLAHELTHVVQQGGGAQAQRIDRDNGDGETETEIDPITLPLETGRLDPATDVITFAEIDIPRFKMAGHRGTQYNAHKPLKRRKNYDRGNPGQRDKWRNTVDTSNIRMQLEDKIKQAQNVDVVDPSATYVFEVPVAGEGARPFMFGNLDTLAQNLTIPMWGGRQRRPPLRFFDVDHIVELQLADWNRDNDSWPNQLSNMELLESSINQRSGRDIRANIIAKVNDFLRVTGTQFGSGVTDIKNRYHLHFETPVASGGTATATPTQFWKEEEIVAGEHLTSVRAADPSALGQAGRVRVFSTPSGGLGKGFNWPGGVEDPMERDWLKPFRITEKHFATEGEGVENTPQFGHFMIEIPADDEVWEPLPEGRRRIEINRVTGARYAGWIPKATIRPHLLGLNKKGMSPIRIDTFDLLPDRGIYVAGAVLPTLPLLNGTGLEFELSEGALRLRKEFVAEDLSVPPPFSVRSASLVIFADTSVGLGAEGRIDFGIDRVGEGHVVAEASTSGGISLAGGFDFDTELFSRAEASVAYEDGEWSFSGTLGIDEGKVRGVRSAEITVGYENEVLSADGTAQLGVPGVESGSINMELGPEGFTLGGEFQLSSDIPGIESGSVNATLTRSADTGEWQISAGGRAVPSIPGIDSELSIQYDNGIITIGGRASYERGILSGEVEFGATNRAVGSDGAPTGEIADSLRAYGSGSLTVTLTPWLAATAGVRFLENGEIEVQGRLGLPDAIDVFDRREMRRNLFTAPTIEIPLFAIPLGPRSIGLVAQIGGGLEFRAGFGPGQLRQLEAEITYNPDHPEQTTVTGRGRFVVPADAGLILSARLGVGASVAIASVTGGLEVAGILGLEAEAGAGVEISWSPGTGITLDAEADVSVSPKFRFEVNAFLRASLDLWVTDISETWRTNLTEFEWGPGITFGLRFPVRYRQGEPFNISFDDLEVTYPDLDITQMAGDLAKDIKDRIF